ncbi:MAG TPA: NAD(P)-dependent oxidoreductase, partial [Ktedonobacterales bacterium]|nr:NAD(P)-dependent oxidoreductase [Ktedonobacterales bacterium]
MRVLVTGAYGNIGASSVRELRRQGHQVRAFGRPSRANRRVAASFGQRVELRWGDVRDPSAVARAVEGQDAVVHMAYILPPVADDHPALAEAVNIGGTRNVIEAACAQAVPPRLLFASTFDIFGFTQDQPPPRRVTDPVAATDAYTRHKIEGERMVRESGLRWTILRFADVPPLAMRSPHPIMFRIPLQTRFEVLHTDDAGLAVANALASDAVWGRVWLIGGGLSC